MTLFLSVFIPIAILGFLYLFIIENNGLPDWMAIAFRNSSSIWTYGIIAITSLSSIKYFWGNQLVMTRIFIKLSLKDIVELVPKLIKKNDYSNLEALCIERTFFK